MFVKDMSEAEAKKELAESRIKLDRIRLAIDDINRRADNPANGREACNEARRNATYLTKTLQKKAVV